METPIQQVQPQGSPLLAYGESRRPQLNPKLLAIIAGIFVCASVIATIFLLPPVQLPQHTFVFAVVRSKTTLPSGSPEAWKAASASSFPFVLGLAASDNGVMPYAITIGGTPRTSLQTERSGLFTLISSTSLERDTSSRGLSLPNILSKVFSAPAYLRVTPSALSSQLPGPIDGPIQDGVWKTSISIAQHSNEHLLDGDAGVDLIAFPDAWLPIQHTLTSEALSLDGLDAPDAISWTASSGTVSHIAMNYATEPPQDSVALIGSRLGLHDTKIMTLPDNEIAEELLLPTQLLSTTGTRTWTTELGSLEITDHAVFVSATGTATTTSADVPGCTGGSTVVFLGRPLLQNLYQQTGLSLLLNASSIIGSVKDGSLVFCSRP